MALTEVETDIIADLSVTTEKLADLGVTTAKIANNAITAEKLAPDAVAIPGYTFIESKPASSSPSLDFKDLVTTNFSSFRFILNNILAVTDLQTLWIRASVDNGLTFETTGYEWAGAGRTSTGAAIGINDISDSEIEVVQALRLGNELSAGVFGTIDFFPQSATDSAFNYQLKYKDGFLSASATISGVGNFFGLNDPDAVRFLISSGNIASGDITLYGAT